MPDTPAGARGATTLQLDELLHPTDFSRMLLAVSATTITIGIYVVVLVAAGGLALLAIVTGAILVTILSVWLALQLVRARLLGASVRVSHDSLPAIQELIDDVRGRLDYHRPVDVYITQKFNPSVSLTSYFGTKVIVIEGSLIGDFIDGETRAQLTFLLARHFGALKARHQRLSVAIVVLEGLRLLPYTALFLLPYFRATTYSGDQIGLACCGSLDTALTATQRLLVGKEVEPSLRTRGVVAQAELVRRRWLPRLIQMVLPEPHLTNRFVNLVHYCGRTEPAAYDAFRASLDEATLARVDALKRRSAYRKPARSRARKSVLAAIAVCVTVASLGAATAMALSVRDGVTDIAFKPETETPVPPPAATDAETFEPSGEPDATPGDPALLAHVPTDVRDSCVAEDSSLGAVARVRCAVGDTTTYYSLFASSADLDSSFDASQANHGGSTEDDCESGSYDATWSIGGETAGRLLCYQHEGASWIVWTHDELLIEGSMLRLDDDSASLYAAWEDAGPE